MNNACCYSLYIQQITCQNGVRRVIDNTYENIENGSIIQLSFGYTLTVNSRSSSSISIKIENTNYIPSLIFSIPVDSYKEFNVPKESGTLIIRVGVKNVACPTTQCCSNSI